jgi:hypothetical protein
MLQGTAQKAKIVMNCAKCRLLVSVTFDNGFNPFNAELNPICHFLALLANHILHVSRIRVKVGIQTVRVKIH